MKYELADVMTAGEAEKIWSIKVDTLKKVCSGQAGISISIYVRGMPKIQGIGLCPSGHGAPVRY